MAIAETARQERIKASSFAVDAWRSYVSSLSAVWLECLARKRYRDDLRRLLRAGPHMIGDVGLEIDQAYAEMAKPFWRA